MNIIREVSKMQSWRNALTPGISVGFVPTMGALHKGHLALVNRSLQENDHTVVSIFVNPLQFGPKEDFSKYPRPLSTDSALLKKNGITVLFTPSAKSMYGSNFLTRVTVSSLTDRLCGSPLSRGAGHFEGVSTVVTKLFNAVRPTRAYFGMKDFQQLRIVEQLTLDLNMGIKIVRCPTVRELDGLALSSRNQYLSQAERRLAPNLYHALQAGRKLLRSRPSMRASALSQKVKTILLKHPEFKIDYIELVDPATLKPSTTGVAPLLLAAAVRLGRTRLIDNLLVTR